MLSIIAALLVGFLCASVGLFMVLRRASFIGDGLAHVSLGAAAAAIIARIDTTLTALAVTVVSAVAIARITQRTRLPEDVMIMTFYAGSLALAAILISIAGPMDLEALLFGDIGAVTGLDVLLIAGLAIVVLFVLVANSRALIFATFDAESATATGLPVARLNYLLLILVALTITASMKVAGVLMVASLIAVPPATALLLKRGFKETAFLANGLAATSVLIGSLAALEFGVSSGGAIVMTAVLLFFAVLGARVLSRPVIK